MEKRLSFLGVCSIAACVVSCDEVRDVLRSRPADAGPELDAYCTGTGDVVDRLSPVHMSDEG